MEGHTIQWPSERRVNGRTDNAMVFHLAFFLMAIVLSVLPFTLLSDGYCIVCPSRVNGRTDNTSHQKKG
jgi:hypothetical protein